MTGEKERSRCWEALICFPFFLHPWRPAGLCLSLDRCNSLLPHVLIFFPATFVLYHTHNLSFWTLIAFASKSAVYRMEVPSRYPLVFFYFYPIIILLCWCFTAGDPIIPQKAPKLFTVINSQHRSKDQKDWYIDNIISLQSTIRIRMN